MSGRSRPTPANRQRLEDAFVRHRQGDIEYAYATYRRALDEDPNNPIALHYMGLVAQQAGRSGDACELLQRSISIAPDDPRAHNHLGQVLWALKRRAQAVAAFERALTLDPEFAGAINNLANAIKPRDLQRAIALYRRVLELDPAAGHAAYNLANALQEDQRFEEARAAFARAIQIEPRNHLAHCNLGVLLEQQGEFGQAIDHYLAARRLEPRHVGTLARLLSMRDHEPGEQAIHDAEELLTSGRVRADELTRLHTGLGRYYDRRSQYDTAFEHFAAAKSIVRERSARFEIERVAARFDDIARSFTREWFESRQPRGSESEQPVFIVGLPRSGTTLTERILASHPDIAAGGELLALSRIARDVWPPYPRSIPALDAAGLGQLADEYLQALHLAALQGGGAARAPRITDKFPLNFSHLGFIAALFPRARIIHCRRDPLDTALSCFSERFKLEEDFTTDLRHFGEYFLQYERMMAHWRVVLPQPMLELRYEMLIADPRACSRQLIEHCGLAWHDACLNFHDRGGVIRTPSRWQARQPIYSASVGRWRNYSKHLAPLSDLLEANGYRCGNP